MNEPMYDDAALAAIYKVITRDGGELGLSLLVGGSWLTGTAISGRAWFNQLGHVIDESPGEGNFGDAFRHVGQQIYPADIEVEAGLAEPIDDDRPIGFIHLRDARLILDGDSLVPTDGGLIRCRIDHVSAWLLGNLGPPGYRSPPPAV